PASTPSLTRRRLRALGSPPYRKCSMTCSDSGLTPSSSAAARIRSSTAAASASAIFPRTLTTGDPGAGTPAPDQGSPAMSPSPIGIRRTRLLPLARGRGPWSRLASSRRSWGLLAGQPLLVVVSPLRLVAPAAARVPHRPVRITLDGDEAIAHVADGADQGLVLRAELGAQPAHMHVDGAGAAEVVVAPHLLEQLGPAEYPARRLGEEFQ